MTSVRCGEERDAGPPQQLAVSVPFTLSPSRKDTVAVFSVPRGTGERLALSPIAACGGLFTLTFDVAASDEVDVLSTQFYSPKPERTAEAISQRIAMRLSREAPALGECVTS